MTQEVTFNREQVDNLDKVEPYGATADARAASQTANFFSKIAADFGRVFGWHSERTAIQQAKEYAFSYDEETGMPELPETFAVGGRAALEAYQAGLESRYEDNMLSSLEDNLKRAAIGNEENEEGFRQNAAIQIGAMQSKVAPGFEGIFLDAATKLEADIATGIAITKARNDRIRARQSAYNRASRHNDGLGPVTEEQLKTAEQTLIASIGENAWSELNQKQRDVLILRQRTELMRGIGTGELTRTAPDPAAGANGGEVTSAHTIFTNRTEKDLRITSLGMDMLQFPDNMAGDTYYNMSAADKRDWSKAMFPGLHGRHDLWASSAATYNHPDITASQAKVFASTNGQGYLLPGQEAAFTYALSGNAPYQTILQSAENWSNLRGYHTGTNSWANEHPKQAAALDVLDYTLRVEGIGPPQGMKADEYYKTIVQKSQAAAAIDDDVINEGLKLEKGSSRLQREDTIRAIIRNSHPYIMPGPELEAMVDQGLAISRVNAAVNGEALSAKDIIDNVIQTSYTEAPFFVRGGGATGGYIPKKDMPIVSNTFDGHTSQQIIRQAVWHAGINNGLDLPEPGRLSRNNPNSWKVLVYDSGTVGISMGGTDMGVRIDVDAINDRIEAANSINDKNIMREINLLEIQARQYLNLNGEFNDGTDPFIIDIQKSIADLQAQLVSIDLNFAFEGFVGVRTE